MDGASRPPWRAAGLHSACRLSLLAAASSRRKPQMCRLASFSKTPEKLLLRCEMYAPTAGEYRSNVTAALSSRVFCLFRVGVLLPSACPLARHCAISQKRQQFSFCTQAGVLGFQLFHELQHAAGEDRPPFVQRRADARQRLRAGAAA